MFNKFFKKEKKDFNTYQKRITEVSNKILNTIELERISEYEMIDLLANLQKNFQLSLLEKNDK